MCIDLGMGLQRLNLKKPPEVWCGLSVSLSRFPTRGASHHVLIEEGKAFVLSCLVEGA